MFLFCPEDFRAIVGGGSRVSLLLLVIVFRYSDDTRYILRNIFSYGSRDLNVSLAIVGNTAPRRGSRKPPR